MLTIALTVPIILFLVLGRATRSGWRLEALLLFVSPLIAALLSLAGDAAIFGDVGPLSSIRDFVAFMAAACLFILPEGIYPSGACIAALILLGWFVLEKVWSLVTETQMRRILIGSAMGVAIGLSFAVLILLAYMSPRFVEFMEHRDRPPPLLVPMSILTGAIDGFLIAYFLPKISFSNSESQGKLAIPAHMT
jgi:hypothetical protein